MSTMETVDPRVAAERRDAARLLLRQPLLRSHGPDADSYRLVRRHHQHLAEQFRQVLGYRLAIEPGFARLYKAGLGPNRSRALLRQSGSPFPPRAYAYLALVCSVLLTSRSQVLLSNLVVDVRQAATEAGIELGADSVADRRALVAALRQLLTWGVLSEDDGSIAGYADEPGSEALLTVDRDLVRHLLAVPLREVDTAAELVRLAADPGPGGPRHSVRRRLVEEPVVAVEELEEEERAWLRQYQRREERTLADLAGLELEIRAEGVAAIDPQDELTDLRFPREHTLGQAALLAVAELVRRLAPVQVPHPRDAVFTSVDVPAAMLDEVVSGLLAVHGRRWKKDYRDRPELLPRDVEDLLVAAGLLERALDGSDLKLRAVAARYAPEVAVVAPVATTALPFDPPPGGDA